MGLLKVPFSRPDHFTPEMTIEYVDSTCISLLFSKIMHSYIETKKLGCLRYNCQMVVLSQKIYTHFFLRPVTATKFALIAFCLKILQVNQQHDTLSCVHVVLMNLLSEHKRVDDKIFMTSHTILSVCTQLVAEDNSNVAHLRMHLCIFENIMSFRECFASRRRK